MGKIVIKNTVSADNSVAETSIRSLLETLKVSKIAGVYRILVGSTEIEISSDLMKDLVENTFMMLDYEDQMDLLKSFSELVR